jgi:hypothetical protein
MCGKGEVEKNYEGKKAKWGEEEVQRRTKEEKGGRRGRKLIKAEERRKR